MIYNGDCVDILKTLLDDSVDALVTDPPAGISFMGKDWDHHKGGRKEWCAWMESVMRECLRVLKPGAHGLVWALPRTAHWTATALEDAGFEIRDCITHLFGQGFPKSLNISKAIDKSAGAEREVVGRHTTGRKATPKQDIRSGKPHAGRQTAIIDLSEITAPATDAAKQWDGWGTALKPAAEFWWLVRKPCSEKTVAENVLKWGTGGINIDGCRIESAARPLREMDRRPMGSSTYQGAADGSTSGSKAVGETTQGRFPANLVFSHSPNCTEDACDMFECAVEMLDEQSGVSKSTKKFTSDNGVYGKYNDKLRANSGGLGDTGGASRFFFKASYGNGDELSVTPAGSNLNDGGEHGNLVADSQRVTHKASISGIPDKINIVLNDTPTRFLYCAKISPSERNAGLEGVEPKLRANANKMMGEAGAMKTGSGNDRTTLFKNHHPTVKPQKLMRYLCRLITPPGGTVLDPFMGSGSTGLAAKSEGFEFIGIEREPEYFEISKTRIG